MIYSDWRPRYNFAGAHRIRFFYGLGGFERVFAIGFEREGIGNSEKYLWELTKEEATNLRYVLDQYLEGKI